MHSMFLDQLKSVVTHTVTAAMSLAHQRLPLQRNQQGDHESTDMLSAAPVRPPSCCSSVAPPRLGATMSCGSSGPGDNKRAASEPLGTAALACSSKVRKASCPYSLGSNNLNKR